MAGFEEGEDFGFVGGEGGWHGLLGVVVGEFAEVEGPGWEVSGSLGILWVGNQLFEVSNLDCNWLAGKFNV